MFSKRDFPMTNGVGFHSIFLEADVVNDGASIGLDRDWVLTVQPNLRAVKGQQNLATYVKIELSFERVRVKPVSNSIFGDGLSTRMAHIKERELRK